MALYYSHLRGKWQGGGRLSRLSMSLQARDQGQWERDQQGRDQAQWGRLEDSCCGAGFTVGMQSQFVVRWICSLCSRGACRGYTWYSETIELSGWNYLTLLLEPLLRLKVLLSSTSREPSPSTFLIRSSTPQISLMASGQQQPSSIPTAPINPLLMRSMVSANLPNRVQLASIRRQFCFYSCANQRESECSVSAWICGCSTREQAQQNERS